MPTTLVGLLLFVGFLVPGFVHYTQRRWRVPQRSLSPLLETANLITVSAATNAIVLVLFGLYRMVEAEHSPDVKRMAVEGWSYSARRIGYISLWGFGLLAASTALAFVLGVRPKFIESFSARFAPSLVDVSAWYHVFEDGPADDYVYVGCDLRDGTWVAGVLDWYSTEIVETADRDFAIAAPISFRPANETEDRDIQGFERLVVSARDVVRLYVTYLPDLPKHKGVDDASA
jgi:hypothetical protein